MCVLLYIHISLYSVLPEVFLVNKIVYKHVSVTSLLSVYTYPQSFMLMYGFLSELWELNLNKEDNEKKMNNHSLIHLTLAIPIIIKSTTVLSGRDPALGRSDRKVDKV